MTLPSTIDPLFLIVPFRLSDEPNEPYEPDDGDDDDLTRHDSDVKEDVREDLKEPEMWDVLLHNDDYTTKAFVVGVLRMVFRKSAIEATKIMMYVHKHGRGVVGTYTYDVAQTKVARVHEMAKKREYPLRCSIDKAS